MTLRRRRGMGADPFSAENVSSIEDAASVLYGDLERIDRMRPRIVALPLANLVADPMIQVRIGGLDPDTVKTYQEILLNGGEFKDPITAFSEEEYEIYPEAALLADGYHRAEATRLAHEAVQTMTDVELAERGIRRDQFLAIKAAIHYGGLAEALEFAEEANLRHGKSLSSKDKRNILERRILRGHDWFKTSNNAIAQVLGVDAKTITRWKQALAERHPENDFARKAADATQERLTADGRRMQTSGLAKSRQEAAMSDEEKALRNAARAVRKAMDALAGLGYTPEEIDAYTLSVWLAFLQEQQSQ